MKIDKNRITFKIGENIVVLRHGKTSNKKIVQANENIVQTYTFSQSQFEYIYKCEKDSVKPIFSTFFSLDTANCGDCPFAANKAFNVTKIGKCYTHKVMQYSGFISMLKSINKQFDTFADIPTYQESIDVLINFAIDKCSNKYVRFGTYGEPTVLPLKLVNMMSKYSKSYTGYTHQWVKNRDYSKYFMASVHNESGASTAAKFGYRSFIAAKENNSTTAVVCPASKEAGFKSTCSLCGLCSGTAGKGKKDVIILEH